MTGPHAHAIGSPGPVRAVRAVNTGEVGEATLAEILAGNGWQTAAFVSTRALGSELGWASGFALFEAASFLPPIALRAQRATD